MEIKWLLDGINDELHKLTKSSVFFVLPTYVKIIIVRCQNPLDAKIHWMDFRGSYCSFYSFLLQFFLEETNYSYRQCISNLLTILFFLKIRYESPQIN